MMNLTDEQLLRYSRQIFLPNVDVDGQQRLLLSHVCIIGVGGLGSHTAAYLLGAGVGKLTLIDDDEVDVTNLHRQLLYSENDIGESKVSAAKQRLQRLNKDCHIELVDSRLDSAELQTVIRDVDIVLDGTDNFASRLMINEACYKQSRPLLSAAVTQYSGQISLFDYSQGSPCYECLYPNINVDEENNCAENGVLGPVAGIVAAWQALHAMKFLLGLEVESLHRLVLMDMLVGLNRNIVIQKDQNCVICGS